MKKTLIVLAAAAALVGCAENRGGAHYGSGSQSGSDQMTKSNFWYHDDSATNLNSSGAPSSSSGSSSGSYNSSSTNESSHPSTGSGNPSTGTQTGNQTNDRLRP